MPGAGIALDRALAGLLAGCGARAVRVVDGAGVVVAALPLPPVGAADDPATIARLVGEAVVVGRGGLDDVLVTTGNALHLLRPVPVGPIAVSGAFVHLTADLDVDASTARRLLADPGLHAAVAAALSPVRVPPNAPEPVGSTPRSGASRRVPRDARDEVPDRSGARRSPSGMPLAVVPAPRPAPAGANGTSAQPGRAEVPFERVVPLIPDRTGELPALAGLAGRPGRTGDGARAVEVLTRLMPAAPARPAGVPLPRRSPAAAPTATRAAATPATAVSGLPERSWAGDLDTMRRLLVGLRRLA